MVSFYPEGLLLIPVALSLLTILTSTNTNPPG